VKEKKRKGKERKGTMRMRMKRCFEPILDRSHQTADCC